MQRLYLGVVVLLGCLGLGSPATLVKPDPEDGELLVHDFTSLKSTSRNSLGYSVFTAGGMDMTYPDDDPRVILSPRSTSSFLYSFVRQPGQCFDGSNFDYISLELKHEDDLSFMVGYSSNSNHCDETAESVIR